MKTGQDTHQHYSNRSAPPVSLASAIKRRDNAGKPNKRFAAAFYTKIKTP
jgi:hypothetical protein